MVLEATMICVDNSEWMRNGDFAPNRLEAQTDACIQIAARKRDMNPENTVGVLTMAGKKGVSVLCPLVSTMQDLGKILAVLHSREKIRIDGESNFIAALKTATLALKHRAEKRLRQRVLMFVGSPIECTAAELTKTGKALKKNNVAVDIVNFGDAEVNSEKLEAFIEAVNKDGNSRLCAVPPGVILADALRSSEVMTDPDAAADRCEESLPRLRDIGNPGGGGGGGGGTDEMGIDESLQQTDPELYMALRESWEAARATAEQPAEEAPAAAAGDASAGGEGGAAATAAADAAALTDAVVDDEDGGLGDDEELRRAIEMSMAEAAGGAGAEEELLTGDDMAMDDDEADDDGADDMDEDEAMAQALAMSMEGAGHADDAAGAADEELDPAFLQSVLQGLDPEVDPDAVMKQRDQDGAGGGGGSA